MKRVTIVFLIFALVGCSKGQVIEVSKTKSEPKQEKHQNILLSVNDRQLLERFVETEANGEPYIAHVAVASVILNRLKHPDFPHKISNVFSQLNDISDKEITISDTTKKAVDDALLGWDPVGGALHYFMTTDTTDTSSLRVIIKIGNLTFCE